jgi:hypothetical protein
METENDSAEDVARLVVAAEKFAAQLKFNKDSLRHQILVGLLISVIERSQAIFVLLEKELLSAVFPILRCIVETDVEVQLLKIRPLHIRTMELNYIRAQSDMITQAFKNNPYTAKIAEKMDLASLAKTFKEKENKIIKNCSKHIEIHQKYREVGMDDFHQTVYRFLCRETHPSYAGIISRHITYGQTEDDFEITLYKAPHLVFST